MKKVLSIVGGIAASLAVYGFAVLWFAQSNVVAAVPTVKLYIAPATQSLEVGATASLQIRLSKNTNAKVDYTKADLSFSRANFEIVSISKQGSHFTANNGPSSTYNNATGVVSISGSGAELPMTADVLVATINIRGKAAGDGNMNFAASSQAGDMTNGGHVKDALQAKSGATISVNTTTPVEQTTTDTEAIPTEGDEAGGLPVDETQTTETDTPATSEDEPSTASNTGNASQSITETKTEGVADAQSSTSPLWKRYLRVIVGGAALLAGIVGSGFFLVAKRNRLKAAGMLLPTRSNVPVPEAEHMSLGNIEELDAPVQSVTEEKPDEVPVEQVSNEPIPQTVVEPVAPVTQDMSPTPDPSPKPVPAFTPLSAPVPVAPVPASTPVPPPVMQAATSPARNATDYANLPDMFELGEQRLRAEGYGDLKVPARK